MAKISSFSIFRRRSKNDIDSILRPHLRGLYQSAYRWTMNAQDAEDLVQDVVEVAIEKIDVVSTLQQPRSWLTKVMYRQFVDFYRRNLANPVVSECCLYDDEQEKIEPTTPEQESPANQLELNRIHHKIIKSLMQLDEEHRAIVLLYEVEGYAVKEIANMLEIPEGTVKSRLNRSRAKLKSQLENGTFYEVYSCESVGVQ